MFEVSDKSLLYTTVAISSLSLIGIVFLVAVVAALVDKAIKLAKRIEQFQTNITDRVEKFMKSDNYNNFANNVKQSSQNAWSRLDSRFIQPRIAGLTNNATQDLNRMYTDSKNILNNPELRNIEEQVY